MNPDLTPQEVSVLFDLRRALATWPPGLKVSVERGALVVRQGRCVVARWSGVGETRRARAEQARG